jgi:glycerol-3-phosphate dehydrogenase
MFPLRGSLINLIDEGRTINEAYCMSKSEKDNQEMVFIVPRGKNKLILGGTTEPN